MVSPEAVAAARRIVPQYITASWDSPDSWVKEMQKQIDGATQSAAEIIQQAIDAAVAKAKETS